MLTVVNYCSSWCKLKTFISCYRTPRPQKGSWRVPEGVSERVSEGVSEGLLKGPCTCQPKDPFKTPSRTLQRPLQKPFWGPGVLYQQMKVLNVNISARDSRDSNNPQQPGFYVFFSHPEKGQISPDLLAIFYLVTQKGLNLKLRP